MSKTVLFQTIQFSISMLFHKYTVLMSKTVPFQTIQFSISTQFSFIWPIDRTLSGATTPSQSAGASPSDCQVSYPVHLLVEVLLLYREVVSVFYSPSNKLKILLENHVIFSLYPGSAFMIKVNFLSYHSQYNGDNNKMQIRTLHSFLNRSITIIMDCS